jgi:radical SAM protein with 4Fe4S-binding SPASM domain
MSVHQEFEFLIQWHLTERCNLRCTHCYQDGMRTGELSLDEVRAVLDEIGEMFSAWRSSYGVALSPSFNITGGEPFLRADLAEVLREIAARGYDSYLLSNGILLDEKRARQLVETGVKGVQVSLEGPEEVHDAIRGTGSFAASLAGIRCLLAAGIEVTANTTLSEVNADRFLELAGIAARLGVQRMGFSRLVPSGRGAWLVDRMLTGDAIRRLYEKIFSLSFDGMKFVTGDPVASQMRRAEQPSTDEGSVPVGGCAAGVSGLTFLADGTIVPCRRLSIPLGNVRTDSLREIWATSPVLQALRDRSRYHGKCSACPRWASCRGCRAIAYAAARMRGSDSLLSEDPQCVL